MSATTNMQDAIELRAKEAVGAELAKLGHRFDEFDIWLSLAGNLCMLCAAVKASSQLSENTSLYIIGGPTSGGKYPNGVCCVTHGMLAWRETEDGPILSTVSGDVAVAPKKRRDLTA